MEGNFENIEPIIKSLEENNFEDEVDSFKFLNKLFDLNIKVEEINVKYFQ
jgi:hypothetical protein